MLDDWQEVTLGDICSIHARLVDPTTPEHQNLPHIGIERIESGTGRLLPLATAAEDAVTSGKYLFTPSDVIYSKIRPELRKAAFPRISGLASADAYPLRASEHCLPEFLLLVLLSPAFGKESVAKSGRTKMPKINRRELFSIRVLLPTLPEQRRIVDLIGALDAQAKALADEAKSVLNLGEALRHTHFAEPAQCVTRFRDAVTLQRGFDLPVQARQEGLVPVVASNGPVGTHTVPMVTGPGVVTGRSGTIGRVMWAPEDFWPLNTTLYVKDFHGNDPRFVRHLLISMNLASHAGGSTVPSLNRNVLDEVLVFVPSVEGQAQIASELDGLDAISQALGEELDSLRIVRDRLLAELITGAYEIPDSYDVLMAEAV